MKRYLPMLVMGLSFYFISCNSKSGPSAITQKNLDAMHGVTNCFDSKDFSKLGDYIATDAVDHSGEMGEIKGLDRMKAQFERWTANMDSPKTTIIKEMADDDYVMTWNRFTGTYKAAEQGHKAGEKYDMQAIEVAKFKDGKMTDHWAFIDPGEMMKMMAGMKQSQMPMSMHADSTKMKMMGGMQKAKMHQSMHGDSTKMKMKK